MNTTANKRIYQALNRKRFTPRHVMEVGVYYPETSNIFDWIEAGVRTTLIEPDPASIARIEKRFRGYKDVTLHRVAIVDRAGTVRLAQRDASTFISTLAASPAMINDGYEVRAEDTFEVTGVTMDTVDDGSVDLLSVDVEGSEWPVIRHLVSRPAVISVETHGAAYINPHWQDIHEWMRREGYVIWYRDKSDTVFVRPAVVRPTWVDRLRLVFMDRYLAARRVRKQRRARLRRQLRRS